MTTRREIVRDSLGVGVATGTYGISFGVVSLTSAPPAGGDGATG